MGKEDWSMVVTNKELEDYATSVISSFESKERRDEEMDRLDWTYHSSPHIHKNYTNLGMGRI